MKWIKRLLDNLQRIIDDILGKKKPAPGPAEPSKPDPGSDDAARYADGPNTVAHGKAGFLWKPVSESNGKPVVLLPPRFSNKTGDRIKVNGQQLKNKVIANGYREHYPVPNHVDGAATVVAEATDGLGGARSIRWTWRIPDGRVRWDSNISPDMQPL